MLNDISSNVLPLHRAGNFVLPSTVSPPPTMSTTKKACVTTFDCKHFYPHYNWFME